MINRQKTANKGSWGQRATMTALGAVLIGTQLTVLAMVVKPWSQESQAQAAMVMDRAEQETPLIDRSGKFNPVAAPQEPTAAPNAVARTGVEATAPEPVEMLVEELLEKQQLSKDSGSETVTEQATASMPGPRNEPELVAAPINSVETQAEQAKVSYQDPLPANRVAFPYPRRRPDHIVDNAVVTPPAQNGSSHDWLRDQPAQYYTLQLVSMLDAYRVRKLENELSDIHDVQRIAFILDGRTRHVLVQGAYASKADARRAANALRTRTGEKPWPRRISAVVKALESRA